MFNGVGIAEEFVKNMGSEGHIEAEEGDYMGPDGRLHCGKCHEGKELFLKPLGRYVPCLCNCGRAKRYMEEERFRQSQEMHRVEELASYSMMDGKVAKASFASAEVRPDSRRAFETARAYVASFEDLCKQDGDMKGLLLYGPTGSGKSYLVACIANALMVKRVPVLYTSVIKLTSAPLDSLHETIGMMDRAKLLVLDDLGAERGTDFKLEQIFDIIDTRCNKQKPLVVTTNYSAEDMRGEQDLRYKRIWERVKSMCYPVRMDAESWRKQTYQDAKSRFRQTLEGKT